MARLGSYRRDRAPSEHLPDTNQRSGVRKPLQFFPSPLGRDYFLLRFRVGSFLRFVFATRRSSALLIDLYIPRDAPLSDFLERFPRLAASAAPAAICCFFDFAGIAQLFRARCA